MKKLCLMGLTFAAIMLILVSCVGMSENVVEELPDDAQADKVEDADPKADAEPNADDAVENQAKAITDMTDDELIEYLMPAMMLGEECEGSSSSFGVECGEKTYSPLWRADKNIELSEVDEMTELSIYGETSVGDEIYNLDGEYIGDVEWNGYYVAREVLNFSSFSELENYYAQYFSAEYLKEVVEYTKSNIMEFDGKLYLVRGDRGYGYTDYLCQHAFVFNRTEETVSVVVPARWYTGDVAIGIYFFNFIYENDTLVLDGIELQNY